jgi:hypothetical protein
VSEKLMRFGASGEQLKVQRAGYFDLMEEFTGFGLMLDCGCGVGRN